MADPNSDPRLQFHVCYRGTKGLRFYSGAASESDALELMSERVARAVELRLPLEYFIAQRGEYFDVGQEGEARPVVSR